MAQSSAFDPVCSAGANDESLSNGACASTDEDGSGSPPLLALGTLAGSASKCLSRDVEKRWFARRDEKSQR